MYDEFKSIYGETIMAKIFIVEDNPDIIHSTTQELNKWQHDVITVNDWQNVANEILATSPDLVLFDITLPTFDGFYWIQEVRKHSQVPIIVISAAEIDTNVMHAVAAGADDYIMKPFAMTVLLAKIQALLRRNKQRHTIDPRSGSAPLFWSMEFIRREEWGDEFYPVVRAIFRFGGSRLLAKRVHEFLPGLV